MSKSKQPSFPGFTALSNRVFVRQGEDLKGGQPAPGHPRAVVVYGWGDAPPKHVSKFTDGYRKLYPHAKQIAVISPIGKGFFDHVSKRTEDMLPVVNEIFPKDQANSSDSILFHCLSNSGVVNYSATLNAYKELRNEPMPHVLTVYDSTPGQAKPTWSNLKRWSNAMAMGPAAKLPWPFFVTQSIFFGFFIFIQLFDFVTGREPSPEFCERLFFDEKWESKDSTRLFLYGNQDILIPADHIEEYIAYGLSLGYKTESQIFESGHVDHMRKSPERYWETIDNVWRRALSEH
ncbi:transmembrane 53-b [Fusarium longipes]|uniref:Transmembrane 53-b n=1 Tax=Fusarium longipes TaxID=694270 RepID=A0A395S9M2_9HYPO|nr:transmembrane 53-b [Fusarium longipes]